MTDFGLSKVGLINSTDDLSGPDVSSGLMGEHQDDAGPEVAAQRAEKREQRRKQTAVGTPDYLAPEILLGMPHGLFFKSSLFHSIFSSLHIIGNYGNNSQ